MDLSGLGASLSAVPGGYQQGMQNLNQIDIQQLQIADQKAKQIGQQAYFRALQGMFGQGGPPGQPQGPQPPMPGQSSAPPQQAMPGPQMQPPMQVADARGPAQPGPSGVYGRDAVMMPPPAGSQAPAPPMAQLPGASPPPTQAPGGQPQLTWQNIVQHVKQQNPGVNDQALAAAVDHFMPMMTQAAAADWRNMRSQIMLDIANVRAAAGRDIADTRAGGQVDAATVRGEAGRDIATTRAGATMSAAETRAEEQRANREARGEQFKQREERLEKSLQLRTDSTWTRLQQQKEQFEQRIAQGDRRQAVVEWRATLDAQHKLAMEKILSARDMRPKERDEMIKAQNEIYTAQIDRMKNLSSGRGNISDTMPADAEVTVTPAPVKPAAPRVPSSAAPAAMTPAPGETSAASQPPVSALKEGVVTTFGNGQKWTLEGGQPKQVQ